METRDQAYMDRTEVEVAIEYAEIAASYDIPVTLFVTGRAAVEEPDRVEQLVAMENVEIGGHNYWAFDTPIHTAWRAVEKITGGYIGSWNGPRRFQRYEISRTLSVLNERGATVTAWRDHAYRHDHHTASLLADIGVTHFSDTIGPHEQVRRKDGVTVIPVNTPPDHEHVYHAFRTRGSTATTEFDGPFGSTSVEVDQWVDWVLDRIEMVQADGGVATVLAHPSCLWLADEFTAFERLTAEISEMSPSVTSTITGIDPTGG